MLTNYSVEIECSWTICHKRPLPPDFPFLSVNTLLRVTKQELQIDDTQGLVRNGNSFLARSYFKCSDDPSFAAMNFFLECCGTAAEQASGDDLTAIKFILPARDGYIARSDFLPQRLIDCELVQKVESFCRPRQSVRAWRVQEDQWGGLFHILSHAVGGLLLKKAPSACALTGLVALEADLANRLSFPWISEQPLAKKTVAFVDGRERVVSEPILLAGQALGVDMIVLDEPGHWLSTEKNHALPARFVPLDMTVNDGLPLRIVRALGDLEMQIDGLTTISDWFTLPVGKAAAFLGLPCESLEALDICRDKYRQRVASGDPALQVRKGDTATTVVDGTFEFPMVVKPSGGVNSEGVSKVSNYEELETAVNRLFKHQYDHIASIEAVNVEEYCDGPEIDVNIVIFDGEILYAEIADDFPKAGDDPGAASGVFKETAMLYPSALPSAEQEMALASLHHTLLNIGLRSGIYHVEARVSNSRKQYREEDGLLDLRYARAETAREEASVVLIEVNARLPGVMCQAAVNGTYGVDYGALAILMSIRDSERMKTFSQPFLNGPQYWSETCMITSARGGVFRSGDLGEELRQGRPDLARHVSSSMTYFKEGQVVPAPEADCHPWVAWFLVFSRVSRKDLLEKVCEIREAVVLKLE